MSLEFLKYPIGEFTYKESYTKVEIDENIKVIELLPDKLEKLLSGVTVEKLWKSYRPGGWSGIQLIHHFADSHINGYVRTKLALTENTPVIKPYNESLWAETSDAKDENIILSLTLIKSLHKKWSNLFRSLTQDELNKTYYHPEQQKEISIIQLIALYCWHSKHHLAHLKIIIET